MWKKLFSWKDFWPVPVLLVIGVFFLISGTEGSPLRVLLGIVTIVWTLCIFLQQIVNRIRILCSPDYKAMKEDLSEAESFLGGSVYLGKDWLFSSYKGKIYRCEDVRSLEQKVSRPPRGSATARLTALVNGEGRVVLAGYIYEEKNIRQANALMKALERRQKPAEEPEAGNPDPAASAETAPIRPEEESAQPQSAPEPAGEPERSTPPISGAPSAEFREAEKEPPEKTDMPTAGSGE